MPLIKHILITLCCKDIEKTNIHSLLLDVVGNKGSKEDSTDIRNFQNRKLLGQFQFYACHAIMMSNSSLRTSRCVLTFISWWTSVLPSLRSYPFFQGFGRPSCGTFHLIIFRIPILTEYRRHNRPTLAASILMPRNVYSQVYRSFMSLEFQ